MKIKKLENKEVKVVAGQKNCTKVGKPIYYLIDKDCLADCSRVNKPRYWIAKTH